MIPPRIKCSGDEQAAHLLLRFAKEQLRVLNGEMAHQQLFQGVRRWQDDSGRIVEVRQIGSRPDIWIHVPVLGVPEEEEPTWVVQCWCTCCLAEGKILRRIGNYGHRGFYENEDVFPYPYNCNHTPASIGNFTGIRYEVEICQEDHTDRWVCISSDFAEYAPGEKVIVLWHGHWQGDSQNPAGCYGCSARGCEGACHTNHPAWLKDLHALYPNLTQKRFAEGVFSVVPFRVAGVSRNDWETPEGVREKELWQWTQGEAALTCILPGSVVAVDRETNMATVLLDTYETVTVPVFYHCECYEDTRDGAWALETEDDAISGATEYLRNYRVLVAGKRDSEGEYLERKIIGFADRLPRLCFSCGTWTPSEVHPDNERIVMIPNNSDVEFTFQGGCPSFRWGVIAPGESGFEPLNTGHTLAAETTEERVNTLHVNSASMCKQIVPITLTIGDVNFHDLECGAFVGCPPGGVEIAFTNGPDVPSGDYAAMHSSDGHQYEWHCKSGCQGGGFYEQPNYPPPDGPDYPCGATMLWRTPGRRCPGREEAVIEIYCDADGVLGDDRGAKLMATATVTSSYDQVPSLVYGDTELACGEMATVSISPQAPVKWVVTDKDGEWESYEDEVTVTAPLENDDCGASGSVTVTAYCVETTESGEILTPIGSVAFWVNCYEGNTNLTAYIKYECAYTYGSGAECRTYGYITQYNCLGEIVYGPVGGQWTGCQVPTSAVPGGCSNLQCCDAIHSFYCPYCNSPYAPVQDVRSVDGSGPCWAGCALIDSACCPEDLTG